VKRFAGTLFGSYNGKRYSATGLIATNNLSNLENGGITESIYLTNPPYGYTSAANFPINISVDAQSTYKHTQFFTITNIVWDSNARYAVQRIQR